MNLYNFKKDIYSQGGEDGISSEICKRLEINKGWFCEFGACDGKTISNCRQFADLGWNGIFIESNPKYADSLNNNIKCYEGRVSGIIKTVSITGDSSLDNILKKTAIPSNFDLLSIDVDSYDYQIWESLNNYLPTIVIIEANSLFEPGNYQIHSPQKIPKFQGSSFSSLLELGIKKGYSLVCHNGNMFFVLKDKISKINLDPQNIEDPNTLFCWEKHYEEKKLNGL